MANIGIYSYEEYLRLVESFHGSVAPGLVIGGFMVDLARKRIPEGVLFDAISETTACLPDAVQLLTPCTIGNGWLRVFNLGRFALSLYDKYEGEGVRVFVDPDKLEPWPAIKSWLFKLKPKKEQDKDLLMSQIEQAGHSICSLQSIKVQGRHLGKKSRGRIATCILCHEPYPARDGAICRACQGETPYVAFAPADGQDQPELPPLKAVPAEEAVGKKALHDMTLIIPGVSKGAAFSHGEKITVGDLCRLQQMGRQRVYVQEENSIPPEWVHENDAALAFAKSMAGEGVTFEERPHEGKINLIADRDGLFVVREDRLEGFNMIQGVMCASRRTCVIVERDRPVAATRAIPLLLPRKDFERALTILDDGPIFKVLPLRKARVGILVTGTEVFQGLIEDKFIPIITAKVEKHGCSVVGSSVVPDDRGAISEGIRQLLQSGADLIVTTAGLSVDPDDVTRQGLIDAGATNMLYGAPILPGAMTLIARIGNAQVMGVPACALFHKTTSLDLLLPRMLANLEITRRDLAKLGHGAFCLACKTCTFPKCPFGG